MDSITDEQALSHHLRPWETLKHIFPLGVICFKGVAAHFIVFHHRLVEKLKWIDDSTLAELFSMTNALPGPASAQALFSIAWMKSGYFAAIMAYITFILPGYLILTFVAVGVSFLPQTLPVWAVMIRSAMSAAAVGFIAAGGLKLFMRIVKSPLLIWVCCYGTCLAMILGPQTYQAPVVVIGGALIVWLDKLYGWFRSKPRDEDEAEPEDKIVLEVLTEKQEDIPATDYFAMFNKRWWSWAYGGLLLLLLVCSFVLIAVLPPHNLFRLMSYFYITGTLVFGGGPVLIDYLYVYLVVQGWLSAQAFLFGLAITNIIPGPPFNYSAFAGGLSWLHLHGSMTDGDKIGTVVLGSIAAASSTFFPGALVQLAALPLWKTIRNSKNIRMTLDGILAASVGLVFSCVYGVWMVLRDVDSKDSKNISAGWEAAIAVFAFTGMGVFSIMPAYIITLAIIVALLNFAALQ